MNNLQEILAGFNPSQTQARRVFHGRGQCYPGFEWLTIDYFNPVLLVTTFKQVEDAALMEVINLLMQLDASVIAIQHRWKDHRLDVLKGALPDRWLAEEDGLHFQLQPGQQNIGFFLDMHPGRQWLRDNCDSKKVLNLFAYTCSLSVAACAGNANSVVNIDLSSKSLAKGQLNHHLNNFADKQVSYLSHNIFKSWGKLKKLGAYDIVIVDPPSFQKGSFELHKDYIKLLRKLPELLNPNAKLLLCLNSPHIKRQFIFDLIDELDLPWQLESLLPRAAGYVEQHEDAGLKAMIFRS